MPDAKAVAAAAQAFAERARAAAGRPRGMIRYRARFPADPDRAVGDDRLFALKVSGLVFDGGYTLAERIDQRNKPGLTIAAPESVPDYPKIIVAGGRTDPADAPATQQSWAQQMFNFNGASNGDVTGSVGEESDKRRSGPADSRTSDKPPGPTKVEVGDHLGCRSSPATSTRPASAPSSRACRAAARSSTPAAASSTCAKTCSRPPRSGVEAKVNELKDLEARIKTAMGNRDEAEESRFKSIVSMYENMKPKDAARIFDRLDMKILVDVSTQMNPRKHVGHPRPDVAGRGRAADRRARQPRQRAEPAGADQLPKIEGKPKIVRQIESSPTAGAVACASSTVNAPLNANP